DDAGPLLLADLVPRHDPVLVRLVGRVAGALGEGRLDGCELVERAAVAPAHELRPELLVLDLERADEGRLQDALADPERVATLADLGVAELRADGGGNIRRERPWRRRP